MGRRLSAFVPIHEEGETVWYGPDSKVPAKHAKLIGDHAWTEGDADEPASEPAAPTPPSGPTPPPLSGKGSGTEAWADYAKELDVEVDAEAKRDDIVEAIRAAGHPVEQQ